MLIGINGYEAVVPRFGFDKKGLPVRVGSSEYCFELLTFLNKIDKQNQYLIYLPTDPASDLPKESENWRYKIVSSQKMWLGVGLSFEFLLKRPKLDVFFSPTHYLPFFTPYNSVMSVLDLSFVHFPNLFKKRDLIKLKYWTKFSVKKAKRVITISKASKDDIIKTYGIPKERAAVTYPGIKSEIRNPKSETNSPARNATQSVAGGKFKMQNSKLLKDKYGVEGEFILFVGTLQPRKNIVRLVEAFSKIKKDIQLVIVGKKGWLYEEILEAPGKFNIQNKVKFLDFVSDEDLPAFYKNARCFVLPSLYEGFGLPVLEAMKYGCPVIASNTSSLPEAGGDAALYVDPMNVEDIAKKLELIIQNSELRGELIKKGYEQVKKFSWEKTARETLDILQEIAKKN